MVLRLLIVNTGILPVPPAKGGAIELHTYYLANELARLGNEVHYVTSVGENACFDKNVQLHKLPYLAFSFHGAFPEMLVSHATGGCLAFLETLKAIQGQRYDVVHGHGNISTGLLASLVKKIKLVFTVHNPTPWMLRSSSLKQAIRVTTFTEFDQKAIERSDKVITVSQYLKKEITSRLRVEDEKIEVIPNGVDVNVFKPSRSDSVGITKKFGIGGPYALFVGRLVEQKGVRFLIEAIAGTRCQAVVVGDGPSREYLLNLCKRLEVEKQVHFTGAVSSHDLHRLYSEAELFVIPSLAEGLPLVGLEAMASGLPLIGSRISGIDEIIHDERNGFLIEPGDSKSLRRRLVQLFEDSSLSRAMGGRSRKIAVTQYSWARVAKRTFEVYKELAS